uniref:Thiamine diphosphokinase n=1 Tax=Caenorhabditis tropicalis TaxID=1561998 RepID=A0A1I7U630_9PELO
MKEYRPFEILDDLSKEEEICVIWLNGDPSSIGTHLETVWNKKGAWRVVTDGGLQEIHRRREVRWPHAICGDFDSIDRKLDTKGAKIIHTPDQNSTDATKAIKWCLEQKNEWHFNRIVLLGGLNGRFDHTMSTLSTLCQFLEVTVVVLDSTNMVFALPEGTSRIHVDLKKTTRMCGVIPISQKSTVVTSKGLKYEMESLPLAFGVLISSSNEVTTDLIELESTAPLIFTIELKF